MSIEHLDERSLRAQSLEPHVDGTAFVYTWTDLPVVTAGTIRLVIVEARGVSAEAAAEAVLDLESTEAVPTAGFTFPTTTSVRLTLDETTKIGARRRRWYRLYLKPDGGTRKVERSGDWDTLTGDPETAAVDPVV